MRLASIAVKNTRRNLPRTLLTTLGVAIAMLAFLLLRTVLSAWLVGAEYSAQDRIATRHKVTFVMTLPKHATETVRQIEGVRGVTWFNWFGGRVPGREDVFFNNLASDPRSFFAVYDEIALPPEQKAYYLDDRQGAIVGARLAKQLGWKVGDRVKLQGTIYPGLWEFNVAGIYTSTRQSMDQSTFYFHWDYMNERQPATARDQVGWITSKIDDAAQSARVAARIDAAFDNAEVQTLSMSERALNTSFIGMMSTLLSATQLISLVILAIMMMILGNTIAMGVRERRREYGVLRALGFTPGHLSAFVLGEATLLGLSGGALGLALAYPLINRGVGRFMEENFTFLFPHFRIAGQDAALAMGLSLVLAVAAAAWPALRASRVRVIDALCKVG